MDYNEAVEHYEAIRRAEAASDDRSLPRKEQVRATVLAQRLWSELGDAGWCVKGGKVMPRPEPRHYMTIVL